MDTLKNIYYKVADHLSSNYVIYYIVLLAAALRVHNFSSASIWNDEGVTIDMVHYGLVDIFKFSLKDVNAPFYPMATYVWCKFFGYSLPTIRFFSVVCSTLTAGVIFKMADKHFGRVAALVSSLWFCFSNIHIYYSEEARCYALLSCLMALSLYYFMELLRSTSTKALVWYSLFSLLAMYTQFFVGTQLAVQGLILLVLHRTNRQFLFRFSLSQIFIAGIFMVWFFPTFLRGGGVDVSTSWIPPTSLMDIRLYLSEMANTENLFYFLFSFYVIAFIIAFILLKKNGNSTVLLLSVALVGSLPFLIVWLISVYVIPIFHLKYLMYTSVAFFVAFGAVFAYIPNHKLIGTAIIAYTLFIMIPETRVTAFRTEEWDKACALEPAFSKDSTCVMVSPYYSEFCYIYYNMRWAYNEQFHAIHSFYKKERNLQNIDDSTTFKARGLTNYKRIIYYDAEPEKDERLPTYLKLHYDSVFVKKLYGIDFYVYDRRDKVVSDTLKKTIN